MAKRKKKKAVKPVKRGRMPDDNTSIDEASLSEDVLVTHSDVPDPHDG